MSYDRSEKKAYDKAIIPFTWKPLLAEPLTPFKICLERGYGYIWIGYKLGDVRKHLAILERKN